MKNFFTDITWQKLVLLLVVILILTRLLAPDVAEWALEGIRTMTNSVMDALDLGG